MSPSRQTIFPLLVLVGNNPGLARTATEAWQLACGGAAMTSVVESLADADRLSSPPQNTLLGLVGPAEQDVTAARAALDVNGLPRWGIVIFGEQPTSNGLTRIPPADWQVRTLAHVLRQALALHQLERENARFRGDLSTFGTRVAHDLRSPLGGILTTVDVLKEVLGEEAPSRVTLLEPILDSSDGLTKLIRQMSTLAKASADEKPKQHFNMGPVFWTAFQRVEREALSLGATIAQPATWPDVVGEPAWVEAMWQAFLSNSLQHSGPKPRIEAGWNQGVGENRFWVVDRGEVPVAKRAALFRPFNLLHHPSAPRGFGLPIVQRLAELQGGSSGYEPAPDGGSCFFFTLPLPAAGAE